MLLWSTFFVRTEMLPVERVVADWERPANLGPLYSLASLYKNAKACPASAVRLRPILSNMKWRGWHWPSSYQIWLESINPFSSYIKPRFTPPSPLSLASFFGWWEWQEILAVLASTRGKQARQGGRGDAMSVAWLGSGPSPHKGIPPILTILLCSLKLHDIWVMLLIWNIHYNPFYLFHVANLPWHS